MYKRLDGVFMYITEYSKWKNYENLDKELKKELLLMSDKDIIESFSQNLEFGTGGLRGIMGPGTNRVNVYTIRKATLGFANYLINTNQTRGVAISYDNRKNSKVFAYEAAKVLTSKNIKTYLFESLRPTPMLSYAVRHFGLSGGIMITASHNPKEYNGYKAYNSLGGQLTLDEADKVISYVNKVEDIFEEFNMNDSLLNIVDESFDNIYLNEVKKISTKNTNKNIKVLYSPLHGTGGEVIPKLLKSEGYNIKVVDEQMKVDPNFSKAKSSNPEEKEAFEMAYLYAETVKPDLILLTDPDADRLGASVLHNDKYQMLNGNQIAVVMINYVLENFKFIDKEAYVYKTIVTTNLIDEMVNSYKHVNLKETLTGFKFIADEAEKIKDTHIFLFGCEESYGYLRSDFVRDKDAVQAAYLLTEIQSYLKDNESTMIDYLNSIYKKYGYYYEHTESITLKGLDGKEKINTIMEHFRTNSLNIKNFNVNKFEDYLNNKRYINNKEEPLNFDKSNVLKFYNEDGEWITLRPSGTEPKIKIYFSVKDSSLNKAKEKALFLLDEIMHIVNNL